jgi:YidC/Oxa1 family membrane protein insertase
MDFFSFGPIAAVLDGAYRFVTALASAVDPAVGATSGLVAVVILTMLVRALLIPVGRSQVRAEFTRRRLAPKLAELQKQHGKDRETLSRKTMELYAAENASPFAGFLPLLLQLPVISLVYALFTHAQIAGHANALLSEQVLGAPLGTSFVGLAGAVGTVWPSVLVYLIVLALIAGVTTVSRHVLAAPLPDGSAPSGFARALSFLPYVTVVFAAFVPLAAAAYILTSTAWTVVERYTLRRMLDPARGARSRPAVG